MVRGKTFVGCLAVSSLFLIASLALPGCGAGDNATGNQVKDVSPEVRQQVEETVSKGYSKDYAAKYSKKKR